MALRRGFRLMIEWLGLALAGPALLAFLHLGAVLMVPSVLLMRESGPVTLLFLLPSGWVAWLCASLAGMALFGAWRLAYRREGASRVCGKRPPSRF